MYLLYLEICYLFRQTVNIRKHEYNFMIVYRYKNYTCIKMCQLELVNLGYWMIVDEDTSLTYIVEPEQQTDDGALATA